MVSMKSVGTLLILSAVFLLAVSPANGAEPREPGLPAFPGAEGFGAVSKGGRGGRVIKVTNLNPKGPGSLQWACDQEGPRIVVFEVSGLIVAPGKGQHQRIMVKHPYLTIAGQTAPGAGITIQGKLSMYGGIRGGAKQLHDITVRFLRMRPRKYPPFVTGGRSFETGDIDRFIADHISVAWGVDEEMGLGKSWSFTVQWSTVEESAISFEGTGQHNYGVLVGYSKTGSVTLHHNLFAHHSERAPLCGLEVMDYRNNVIYNVGAAIQSHPASKNLRRRGKPFRINVVGNYFKGGPGGPNGPRCCAPPTTRTRPGISGRFELYATDNFFDWSTGNRGDSGERGESFEYQYKGFRADKPWPAPPVKTRTAKAAYSEVLAHAGCLPRDAVTRRTVEETERRTGFWGRTDPEEGLMDGLSPGKAPADSDDDGMPDEWEKAHGLGPKDPADANKIVPAGASKGDRHKGYTYIEFYINDLADRLIERAITEAKANKAAGATTRPRPNYDPPEANLRPRQRDAQHPATPASRKSKVRTGRKSSIAAGAAQSMLVRADSTVWSWGVNWRGQLGDGTGKDSNLPVQVMIKENAPLTHAMRVSSSGAHAAAVLNDGSVWCWGHNNYGQIGSGAAGKSALFATQVKGPDSQGFLTDIAAVSAGCYHCVAVRRDGTVWAWGLNDDCQLGDGTGKDQPVPVAVKMSGDKGAAAMTEVIDVAAGAKHSVALRTDGSVCAWGDNLLGQCGDGTAEDRPFAVKVKSLGTVTSIAAGWFHTLALKADGTVWAWGYNHFGQLGDGSEKDRRIPIQVRGPEGKGFLTDVAAIACGGRHSLALRKDGTVWTWGINYFGELGLGRGWCCNEDREVIGERQHFPVQVKGVRDKGFLTGAVAIAGGGAHSAAKLGNGTIVSWGNNIRGQMGDGTRDAWLKDGEYVKQGKRSNKQMRKEVGARLSVNRPWPIPAKLP